ncbi:MAG: helix-hairpin-helix domain-containing protein [Hyphomicrobiaceae bacterium]|nr:helix-hairpin-helix domain-containing protein [Hyphomicrobiaceae bacterium]
MATSPTQFDLYNEPAVVRERHGRIDLNTAPEDVLTAFSAVGPARIQALVHRRPFRSWDDVARVPGISQSIIERLQRSGAGLD